MNAEENRLRIARDLANKGPGAAPSGNRGATGRSIGMVIVRHPKMTEPSGRSARSHRGSNAGPRIKGSVRAEQLA